MVAEIIRIIFGFLNKLNLDCSILFGIIISAVLLFSPDSFLKRIGVFDLTQHYRSWIGLTLTISVTLFVLRIVRLAVNFIKGLRWNCRIKQRLHHLTEGEKQILRYYIFKQTRTNRLRIDDGIVCGLITDGIIYRSTSIGNMVEGFDYNISDVAWDYLHSHQYLLNGSTNKCRTDEFQSLYPGPSIG